MPDQLSAGRVLEAIELERGGSINTFRFDRLNRLVGIAYQSSGWNMPRSDAAGISRRAARGRLNPPVVGRACIVHVSRCHLARVPIHVVDAVA